MLIARFPIDWRKWIETLFTFRGLGLCAKFMIFMVKLDFVLGVLRTAGVLNNGTFTVNPGGDLLFDNRTSNHTFPAFFNLGDLDNQGSVIIKEFRR